MSKETTNKFEQGPKLIPIKEFREKGFLQELNRHFLHPLGLALEVIIKDDGTESLGGIWDYRDEPEGIWYGVLSGNRLEAFQKKAVAVNEWKSKKAHERFGALGFIVQPIPGVEPTLMEMFPDNNDMMRETGAFVLTNKSDIDSNKSSETR